MIMRFLKCTSKWRPISSKQRVVESFSLPWSPDNYHLLSTCRTAQPLEYYRQFLVRITSWDFLILPFRISFARFLLLLLHRKKTLGPTEEAFWNSDRQPLTSVGTAGLDSDQPIKLHAYLSFQGRCKPHVLLNLLQQNYGSSCVNGQSGISR